MLPDALLVLCLFSNAGIGAWSTREDLNPQPVDYKTTALPIALRVRAKTQSRTEDECLRNTNFSAKLFRHSRSYRQVSLLLNLTARRYSHSRCRHEWLEGTGLLRLLEALFSQRKFS